MTYNVFGGTLNLAQSTHNPKQHPDPISHFATIHFPDTQTDRSRDGIGDRSIPIALTNVSAIGIDLSPIPSDSERRTNNNTRLMALWDYLGEPVAERSNQSGFTGI